MITVLFSCEECGVRDQAVEVTARKSHEDISKWMNTTMIETVAARHYLLSPHCKAKKITALKIPLNNTDDAFIGQQTSNIPPKGKE